MFDLEELSNKYLFFLGYLLAHSLPEPVFLMKASLSLSRSRSRLFLRALLKTASQRYRSVIPLDLQVTAHRINMANAWFREMKTSEMAMQNTLAV